MTTLPRVLCTDPECRFVEADCRRLALAAELEVAPTFALAELERRIPTADVLVTSCFAAVPAELIAAGRRLRGIVKFGVGVDNIDLAAARDRGLPVANCPDYGSGTVADHAFALLLALARRLTRLDRQFRDQGWYWPEAEHCGVELEGKTLGLIGLGRIGRKMARRARGFDMRLVVCDPYVQSDPRAVEDAERELGALQWTNLEDLLSQSDFVSIHCVLTPETRRLIGRRELALMKTTAFLIDVSRGAIIDEESLVEALRAGRLGGAGLDVFGAEPLSRDHALLQLPNVVATPHVAWFTAEASARQSAQAADAVLDVLAGRRPRSVVNGVL